MRTCVDRGGTFTDVVHVAEDGSLSVAKVPSDAAVVGELLNGQADAYDSPDDNGLNQEFWLELTLRYDPSVRFLIADSDNSPLGGGDYYDGIYLFRDGVLTPIGNVKE